MVFHKKNLFIFFIILGLVYYLFKLVTSSVFLKGRDKVNVIFYGEKTRFYSLDKKNVNYLIFFPNLVKVIVPGGYGSYKVGAIGKLVSLENRPDIFKKTFSGATSSMTDLYFYRKKTSIYYVDSVLKETPTFLEILLSKSNANMIDRLFLFNIFSTKSKGNFQIIDLSPFESKGNDAVFDYNSFYKKFQGSFFQRKYRNENINIQITYRESYRTAQLIGQTIEGEGIRVVDLSASQKKSISGCLLTSNKNISTSKTFERLKDFFKCKTRIGETTVSDIILELGDLEKEWAIN